MNKWGLVLMALVIAMACGGTNDPGFLTMSDVAGAYQATTFESEDSSGTVDQLGQGATIQVTLTANGTTTGELFIPGGAVGGGDFVADLAGTWTLTGPLVRLVHSSDSFLRDVGLLYADGQMAGERTSRGITIRVVLTR